MAMLESGWHRPGAKIKPRKAIKGFGEIARIKIGGGY